MQITDIKTYVVHCFRTNWVFVKVLTDAGNAMLEKAELFISLDEKSLAVTAEKKAVNREKYGVKDELIDDATQMICYLKFKLGRTAEELEKFHI